MIEVRRTFRVALSFPGEFRALIEQVALVLAERYGKDRVFYDKWHEHLIWGQDADLRLQTIYEEQSDLVVVFLCRDLKNKAWPYHEYRIVRHILQQGRQNVLLITLDGAPVPGVLNIDVVMDGTQRDPHHIAYSILTRAGYSDSLTPPSATLLNPRIRYQVGRVEARVQVDLLGGGDEIFGCKELGFEYEHEWLPLPHVIEGRKAEWLAEALSEAHQQGVELFNGPCVRLHSFRLNTEQAPDGSERKIPLLSLRPTCWYDHVCSNRRLDREFRDGSGRLTTLRAEFADESRLVATRKIDWIALTNILTVSVVLVTSDRWTVVGRRTSLVDNTPDLYQASAAENIHRWKDEPNDPADPLSVPNDLGAAPLGQTVGADYRPRSAPNPFHTALRGLREEIGDETSEGLGVDDVTMLALAWNREAFNPHLFAFARTRQSREDLNGIIGAARARDAWEVVPQLVRFEPAGELRDLLFTGSWAEVSKGAVLRALVHEFGFTAVAHALR